MNKFLLIGLLITSSIFLANTARAAPIVTTYISKAAFDAVTTTQIIDFEGIAPDGGHIEQNSFLFFGNTFRTVGPRSAEADATIICDSEVIFCAGRPYVSDVIGVNHLEDIFRIDAAENTSSIGGLFSNATETGTFGTFTLFGLSGQIFSGTFAVGATGAGNPQTFIGFSVENDFITGLEFSISTTAWETVDDFQFGTFDAATPVSEPGMLGLMGLGLLGLFRNRIRRSRYAA